MLLLGAVQVAIVLREQLLVQHVAREAARAAAVSAAPGAAASRASAAIDRRVVLDVGVTTTRVRVRAQLVVRTDVALIGPLLPDITVEATATMGREPPP
jgi:Flp pilus assembly protein TadG